MAEEQSQRNTQEMDNTIIQQGKIPVDWKRSLTLPIFKKRGNTNPANNHGITLLSTSVTLFTRILTDIIIPIILNSEEQQGFR